MKWLPWIVFALFGYYLVGNNFGAKLGMIDDHEIAMFLGSDGVIKPSEIPSTILNQTEVGEWGTYLRFRPSYYTLRVIETSLWRDNATLWYIARYLMLVIAMYLAWKILSRYFPQIISYLFVFYVMTMPFWSDLLTRLGPSEIYAVPAILLFIYGLIKRQWVMISVGYLICAGAKENFLFLLPILLGYVGYLTYTKRVTKREITISSLLVGYTAWIVSAILVATSRAGSDIYGADISYSARIARLYQYKRYIVESRHMQVPLLIMLGGMVKVAVTKNIELFKNILVMIVLGAVLLSQYIFYDSQIPSNIRYDYPVMLLFPLLQLWSIKVGLLLLPKKLTRLKPAFWAYVLLGVMMITMIVRRGYDHIQVQAMTSAQTSQQFAEKMSKVVETARNNPDSTLVFVSNKYLSFEPIISVGRYLSAYGITNTMVLSYTPESTMSDPLGIDLESRFMKSMSGEPTEDTSFARFSPTSAMTDTCYSIVFGQAEPIDICPQIVSF